MADINTLLKQNKKWAEKCEQQEPGCFSSMAAGQSPEYLWIGCIDSRMPAEMLTGLKPGEMLVYRNIANLVNASDTSCMSAIQFAVDVLKVKHILVSGHTNCGGVSTALKGAASGNLEQWLSPLTELCQCHSDQLETIPDMAQRADRLSELSIEQQVLNVAETATVQQAWKRGQELTIHGCLYEVASGKLKPLGIKVSGHN